MHPFLLKLLQMQQVDRLNQLINPFSDQLPAIREGYSSVRRGLELPLSTGPITQEIRYVVYKTDTTGLEIYPKDLRRGYHIKMPDVTGLKKRTRRLNKVTCNHTPREALVLQIQLDFMNIPDLDEMETVVDGQKGLYFRGDDAILMESLRCVVLANGMYLSRGLNMEFFRNEGRRYALLGFGESGINYDDYYPGETGALPNEYGYFTYYDKGELTVGTGHPLVFSTSKRRAKEIAGFEIMFTA